MQPQLSLILKELFDVANTRVTIVHPLKYLVTGECVSVAELTERVRAHNQTLIGYVDKDTKSVVVSDGQEEIRWQDVQSLIVLTD
jgi:hypothetical protein